MLMYVAFFCSALPSISVLSSIRVRVSSVKTSVAVVRFACNTREALALPRKKKNILVENLNHNSLVIIHSYFYYIRAHVNWLAIIHT